MKRMGKIFFAIACILLACAPALAENTLVLPDDLTAVEAEAFAGDTSLGSVAVPEGTLTIGSRAFADSSLTEIILPSTLTFIADDAFEGCGPITAIVSDNSYADEWCCAAPGFSAIHACTIDGFFHTATDGEVCIVSYDGSEADVVIPATLRGLPVTSIGEDAFRDCKTLVSVSLPESIVAIGESAFINCKNLAFVSLPEGLEALGASAFYGCSSLTDISIPESISSIPGWCFYYCTSLRSVRLHDGITRLETAAFQKTALTEIDLPSALEYIGPNVFAGCAGLTEMAIPETVTVIGGEAFLNCTGLASIHLPEGLTKLGAGAFKGCSSLEAIRLPGGIPYLQYDTFRDCSSLADVTIAAGPTQIMSSCFRGCSSLREIVVPEGVTVLEDYAFAGCPNLVRAALPESLRSFGASIFDGSDNVVAEVPDGSRAHEYFKYTDVKYTVV